MRRREFIKLITGLATAWPRMARAQQRERMRRIAILMQLAVDDPQAPLWIAGFLQGLERLGWTVGRNVVIDYRWAAANPGLYRKYAAELVALSPDVILAANTFAVRALLEVTRSIPIVFANATDPVGGGLVAHPGGNVTGFSQRDFGLSAKSLELLKELSPGL